MGGMEDQFEGVELTDEQLDEIVGGMSWSSKQSWLESIARAKSSGWSISQFLEVVQNKWNKNKHDGRTLNEIVGFICDNW